MNEGRKALVTGATGFIGSHLVRHLGDLGWKPHCLTRDLKRVPQELSEFDFHVAPLSVDGLRDVITKVAPDIVFHLATHFVARHEPADVDPLIDANIGFGARLLEAMALTDFRKLVNVGTFWQNPTGPEYRPCSLYAATKQAFEDLLQFYTLNRGFSAVTVKLFDTYGPGDTRKKILSHINEAARNGTCLRMSPGEQKVNLLHVKDAVEGLVKAAKRLINVRTPSYESFFLAAEKSIRLKDLVTLFSQATGRSVEAEFGALPYREGEIMSPWTGGEKLPGWAPSISLEQGLAETFSV